jgi:hypothetical protein
MLWISSAGTNLRRLSHSSKAHFGGDPYPKISGSTRRSISGHVVHCQPLTTCIVHNLMPAATIVVRNSPFFN